MPTSEERVQQLLLRGLMPADAERVVTETDARSGALFTPSEAALFATDDEAARALDRLWPLWTPDVPNRFRRLWTAREVGGNA